MLLLPQLIELTLGAGVALIAGGLGVGLYARYKIWLERPAYWNHGSTWWEILYGVRGESRDWIPKKFLLLLLLGVLALIAGAVCLGFAGVMEWDGPNS